MSLLRWLAVALAVAALALVSTFAYGHGSINDAGTFTVIPDKVSGDIVFGGQYKTTEQHAEVEILVCLQRKTSDGWGTPSGACHIAFQQNSKGFQMLRTHNCIADDTYRTAMEGLVYGNSTGVHLRKQFFSSGNFINC
jgi:hypothetical protein